MQNQTALLPDSAKSTNGSLATDDETVAILPLELSVGGMHARQIWRKRNIAIYERGSSLELVFITRQPASKFPDGRTLPPKERYPMPTQWGNRGWSFEAWRLPYLIEFAEKLANMRKNPGALVGKCMRDTRLWLQHLGPLRKPASGSSSRPHISRDPSVFSDRVDGFDGSAQVFAPAPRQSVRCTELVLVAPEGGAL